MILEEVQRNETRVAMRIPNRPIKTQSTTSTGSTTSKNHGSLFVLPLLAVLYTAAILVAVVAAPAVSGHLPYVGHRFLEVYHEAHAPLFPFTLSDVIGFSLAIVGLVIAAGGGIGGGGILVPIYILVLQFSPKHAIPLSNVTVLGGALANTYLNSRKRHPHADRPLIDWDLILIMEPLTIAGALLGAFLNKMLPEEILSLALVLLLAFTANTTLRKAFKMYRKETQQLLAEQGGESELTRLYRMEQSGTNDQDDDDDQEGIPEDGNNTSETQVEPPIQQTSVSTNNHLPPPDGEKEEDDNDSMDEVDIEQENKQQVLNEILKQEAKMPEQNINMLISLFVVVLVINLLKGGGAFQSPLGIKCGSTSFWLANAAMLGWIIYISFQARKLLLQKYQQKRACEYPYAEGDIQWTPRATIVYPLICCLAGFFAGMFGIGGGIVKGPLMLAMGIHPAVSSASSACMILFTSFTATTSFWVFGLLVSDYAFICFVIGFAATLVGQVGLQYVMKRAKAQRNSYIAFSIGGVVLLSAFLMTMQSLLSMASHEKHESGGVCGVSH